ncbi:MAG: class I SAM-dependent methyltransferase, partial [Pseudomonadota bacterium]
EGLLNLISKEELKGKTFLDIGSGSGLHSLAALRNGIAEAVCVDFDPNSVSTTQSVLDAHSPQKNYTVFRQNILEAPDNPKLKDQTFDIVYSWGVLHHTGAMWDAIDNASKFAKPGGIFAIALYKKTPMCGFWKAEKRLYSSLPKWARFPFDYAYAAAFCLAKLVLRQNPIKYIRDYHEQRGMRFMTDVRDWLGGYPYESATPEETKDFMKARGFEFISGINTDPQKGAGLFGSGCAEYVFQKN